MICVTACAQVNHYPDDFLQGKRIVLTRTPHQARPWQEALQRCGAHVLLYPVFTMIPPQQQQPLQQAVALLLAGHFCWVVLSGANAVYALKKQLVALGENARLPGSVKLAAIGNATAAIMKQELGIEACFIAPTPTGQSLGETLPLKQHETVLLPQAQQAQPNLRLALQQRTQHLHIVTAYRNIPHCPAQHPATVFCPTPDPCLVCFASGSSITACLAALRQHNAQHLLSNCTIACMGRSSIQAAKQNRLSIDIACTDVRLATLLLRLKEWCI
ncbi:MAG: uroporphyrinogen-III synthase [Myxococcota bacterium]